MLVPFGTLFGLRKRTPHTGPEHGPYNPQQVDCDTAEDLLVGYYTLEQLGLVKELPKGAREGIIKISRIALSAFDEIGGLQELRYHAVDCNSEGAPYRITFVEPTGRFRIFVSNGYPPCLYARVELIRDPDCHVEGVISNGRLIDESKRNIKRYLSFINAMPPSKQ